MVAVTLAKDVDEDEFGEPPDAEEEQHEGSSQQEHSHTIP